MNISNHKFNVLVTGGSGGIGEAIARKFFENGYNVAIHYSKNKEKAETLVKELNSKNSGVTASCFQADFEKTSDIHEMFSEIRKSFGEIDILVNNAGIGNQKLFTDISYEDWRRTFAINVDSQYICCKEVLPYMIHNQWGRIVNISSMWGEVGASCEVDYSASKAAVIGLTKALAKEVGASGIHVNCVAPGVIDTEMNSHLSKEDMENLAIDTPLGRIGYPNEVADSVFFLCSSNSSFITGQVISPNGGFVI